ncbi:hypothetical protein [Salinispora arenicola]|uniref:hypothetical protein n=1 Tax=Salinispora arenicola TaxID=168697 RepID=UPI0004AF6435|nr:hypothetical protein [Salinispora arenicola]
MTNDSIPTTASNPCPCGDYYCADYAPTDGIDRSDCCQYCGFYDCDRRFGCCLDCHEGSY